MRLSIVKFFFPVCFLAFSVISFTGYGCAFNYEPSYGAETKDYFCELDTDAELGASSYVESVEIAGILDFGPDMCEEEDDGSWSTDAPEGIFLHDQPDEEPTHPFYTWKVLSTVGQRAFGLISNDLYSLFPGAVYPPPQQ